MNNLLQLSFKINDDVFRAGEDEAGNAFILNKPLDEMLRKIDREYSLNFKFDMRTDDTLELSLYASGITDKDAKDFDQEIATMNLNKCTVIVLIGFLQTCVQRGWFQGEFGDQRAQETTPVSPSMPKAKSRY